MKYAAQKIKSTSNNSHGEKIWHLSSILSRLQRMHIRGCYKCSNHRRSFNHSTSFIRHQRIQPQCRNPQETTLCVVSGANRKTHLLCLFICVLGVFKILWGSCRAWHFKLRWDCYRKWWERSQKYPSLGKERPLKPRPGFALLSRVLKMCSAEAWERGAVFWAASQEGMGIFGRFMWPGSTVLCSVPVLLTMLLLLRRGNSALSWNNTGSKEAPAFQVILIVGVIAPNLQDSQG